MVLSNAKNIDGDSYANTLLTMVEVTHFMNYEIREMDGVRNLYYRLKYRTSLKQVLGNLSLTRSRLECMLQSIVNVLRQAEEYLLCQENILWNSNNIFIDVNTGKLVFTYYPGERQNENALQNFLMELIQYVDKGQQQAYLYVMAFYNAVTNPDCTLEKLERCVSCSINGTNCFAEEDNTMNGDNPKRDVSNNKNVDEANNRKKTWVCAGVLVLVNLSVACCLLFGIWPYQYIWVLVVTLILLMAVFLSQEKSDEQEIDQIMRDYQQEQFKEQQQGVPNRRMETQDNMLFSDSQILLTADMETSLLIQGKEQIVVEDYPKETYLKTKLPEKYSDLHMKKNSIVMGSMREGCDYQIRERGVSRMHAKVLKKEDGLYLLDMNSTNGTYVNGKPIDSGKDYLLEEGDVISLAKTVAFVVAKKEVIDR